MCEICHLSVCPPGCPNSDDPLLYGVCAYCDEPIIFGNTDVVADEDDNVFCGEQCLMDYYGCRYFDWDNEAIEEEDSTEDY